MKADYPRILFITPCAFNHVTGGGITFTNLFRDWPKECLATVHNDIVPTSNDVCDRYYRLDRKEIRPIFPFSLRAPRATSLNAPGPASGAPTRTNGGFARLKARAKGAYRALLGNAGIPDRGRLSPELEAWIAEYRPQVVYTLLGTLGYIELVEAVRARFPLPLVVHLMDDGVTDPLRKGLFAARIRRAYGRKFARILPHAALRLGICKKMCSAYAERYGYPFQPFQNTVDVQRWSLHAKRDLAAGDPARIVYMGSIYAFAQLQSIADFCAAVKELAAEGLRLRFDIYTPLKLFSGDVASLPDSRSVFVHDTITDDEEYFRVLGQADALILPVNFDPISVHFIRYSMPTKVPSYLCSGTPILVYGPAETAQVEYALQDGWGRVVDRRDPALLRRGLREILQDAGLRRRVSEAARAMAIENHDSRKVRMDFQGMLRALLGATEKVPAGKAERPHAPERED